MYQYCMIDVDVEIRQAQARPLSLLLTYTFFNTRNKITNQPHFGSRFRAIQTCSYTLVLGVSKIYINVI